MTLTGPKTVQLSSIRTTFFVRKSLNQDHVLYLADLYANGVTIPPITINKNGELIDGRHRIEAMMLCDFTETKAFISGDLDRITMIQEALKSNIKGPLPPTVEDLEHVIELMIASGVKYGALQDLMPIPKSLIKKYYDNIRKRMQRKLVATALDSIIERGLSIAKASEEYGIEASFLKEALGSRKRKQMKDIAPITAAFERRIRGLSMHMTHGSKAIINGFQDGDIGSIEVDDFLKRLKDSTARLIRSAETITERVNAVRHTRLVGLGKED